MYQVISQFQKTLKDNNIPSHNDFALSKQEGYQIQFNGALKEKDSVNILFLAQNILLQEYGHLIEKSVVVGKFLNIALKFSYLEEELQKMIECDRLNLPHAEHRENVLVDYGGPNIAKPLHVGHLRSLVIGQALTNILKMYGHNVETDIHFGDFGQGVGMLIMMVQHMGGLDKIDPNMNSVDFLKIYQKANEMCKLSEHNKFLAQSYTLDLQNKEENAVKIWKFLKETSQKFQMEDINRLGCHFDHLKGESDSYDECVNLLNFMIDQKLAVESEGAFIVMVSESHDTKEIPPFIAQKADGAFLYGMTDLATIKMRDKYDSIYYVVDERQSMHFLQLERVSKKLGFKQKLQHVPFGTVKSKQGTPYKTRDGSVALLKDMIEEVVQAASIKNSESADNIGIGSLKFFDLVNDRKSGYVYDIDSIMSFEGKSGPYVQYAQGRAKSILKKAYNADLKNLNIKISQDTQDIEYKILIECLMFSNAFKKSVDQLSPHHIAFSIYLLSSLFSQFYTRRPVINKEGKIDKNRIAIVYLVQKIISNGLAMLGIQTPDRV